MRGKEYKTYSILYVDVTAIKFVTIRAQGVLEAIQGFHYGLDERDKHFIEIISVNRITNTLI